MMRRLFSTDNFRFIRPLRTPFQNSRFAIVSVSQLHCHRNTVISNPAIKFILDEIEESESSEPPPGRTTYAARNAQPSEKRSSCDPSEVRISHPWPEWIGLMELLFKKGYFEGFGNPFRNGETGLNDSNQIRTACLNFARDRGDLMRYLSRKDIQVVAECGCPCIDRKVVNSGKRLRAHVGVDEGNVCSSCNLRGNCERAYVKARDVECGRTVDVMRFLLTYGLDPIGDTVQNEPCLSKKVKESVRSLLKNLVELSLKELDSCIPKNNLSKETLSVQENKCQKHDQISVPMKQGDWICPSCNFLNFARNIKCLHCDGLFQDRVNKLKHDQDHLPLKKGDWICDNSLTVKVYRCNFLNFAKNTRCLQCREKPPTRQLNPGEWECESCNYINFRRNMICLKCDHRRPKASHPLSKPAELQNGSNYQYWSSNDEEKQNEKKGVYAWRFTENESEDPDVSNSSSEVSGFIDFPIVGGNSDLSRNKQKQERWKMDMLQRSTGDSLIRGSGDDFRPTIHQKSCRFLESTDDEAMDEWFGKKKVF